ncbi:hypothetical protein RCL1_008099 [Eukaryota sp. TZLM3-RCL]
MTCNCIHKTCNVNLSDFTRVRALSFGSFGSTSVYKNSQGNLFCIKEVQSPATSSEPDILRHDLEHPFLVQLYHIFLSNRKLFVCMEFCEGGSLEELLSSRNLVLQKDDIWFILTQLVFGLAYLHEKQFIHRDIKAANIVLVSKTRPYRVKICDFGVSKNVENDYAKTKIGSPITEVICVTISLLLTT